MSRNALRWPLPWSRLKQRALGLCQSSRKRQRSKYSRSKRDRPLRGSIASLQRCIPWTVPNGNERPKLQYRQDFQSQLNLSRSRHNVEITGEKKRNFSQPATKDSGISCNVIAHHGHLLFISCKTSNPLASYLLSCTSSSPAIAPNSSAQFRHSSNSSGENIGSTLSSDCQHCRCKPPV